MMVDCTPDGAGVKLNEEKQKEILKQGKSLGDRFKQFIAFNQGGRGGRNIGKAHDMNMLNRRERGERESTQNTFGSISESE